LAVSVPPAHFLLVVNENRLKFPRHITCVGWAMGHTAKSLGRSVKQLFGKLLIVTGNEQNNIKFQNVFSAIAIRRRSQGWFRMPCPQNF